MTNYKPYKQSAATCIILLLLQVILFSSCGQRTDKKETSTEQQSNISPLSEPKDTQLNMPTDDPYADSIAKRPLTKSTLSLILLKNNWYCYAGADIKSGGYSSREQFHSLLLKNKKTWGDSLFVLIKPSALASYATTVDALDEMAIGEIERYALLKLNPEEEKYFNISSGPSENRVDDLTSDVENIRIYPPTARSAGIPGGSLIIWLTSEEKIGYKIEGEEKDYHFIPIKNKEELTTTIAKYKAKYPGGQVFIKGEKETGYPDFSLVVDALKANNEMKYHLVTDNP